MKQLNQIKKNYGKFYTVEQKLLNEWEMIPQYTIASLTRSLRRQMTAVI